MSCFRSIALTSLAALLPGLTMPLMAETLTLPSRVTAVTLYPDMAQVSRQVRFEAAAAGRFDLVIPDLPAGAEAQGMQFAGAAVTIGAVSLRTDRVPTLETADSPEIAAARAGRDAARLARQQAEDARDAILAKAQAAEAQIAFLSALKLDAGALTPQALVDLTLAVGGQTLAARQAAIAARAEAAPAQTAVETAQKAEAAAQAALDALLAPPGERAALLLTVDVAQAGPVTLDILHYVDSAWWSPGYDLALDDRAVPPALTLDRKALISQDTGEDWTGIQMTLSTARPGGQVAPSMLYPQLRSIGDPVPAPEPSAKADAMAGGEAMVMAAPAPMAEMSTAAADFQGVAVTYHLPAPVSVATGSEEVQIALDRLSLAPEVRAEAVPRMDQTAFVVARWTNTAEEVLLPGPVLLSRDGTLVGMGQLPLVPPGDKQATGFGALEGVKLRLEVPDRSTGDRGVFTSSTEMTQTAILKVDNLTDQAWALRLTDQVPYSEQDDLKIEWSADPAPSATDVDGQRGILAWDMDLAAGAKVEVRVDTALRWPADKVLQ